MMRLANRSLLRCGESLGSFGGHDDELGSCPCLLDIVADDHGDLLQVEHSEEHKGIEPIRAGLDRVDVEVCVSDSAAAVRNVDGKVEGP